MAWALQAISDLSDEQFEHWCFLLEERIGMQIAAHQRSFLQIQISRRMRELGINSYEAYFQRVTDGIQGAMEWSQLVDRLVVRETSFFRERDSLEFIRQLLTRRINDKCLGDVVDIWSLGCATGEEPYSLAMVIHDSFEKTGMNPYFGITASDISMQALQVAREGIYSSRKLETVSPAEKEKYFEPAEPGFFKVVDELRNRICFSVGNLLKLADMPVVPMDIIYCQNVMIYFPRWRRKDILNELVKRLKLGGVLIIGIGEVVDWHSPLVKRVADERIQAYLRC
jgi:chemotaxis protein methyltransferase CheR/type IV pilus assembly protein PilK